LEDHHIDILFFALLVKLAPVFSSALLLFLHKHSLFRKTKFFFFLTLMGLGLTQIFEVLFSVIYPFFVTIGHKQYFIFYIQSDTLMSVFASFLAVVLQCRLVKHWKLFEAANTQKM
jgi:hypothetical protein